MIAEAVANHGTDRVQFSVSAAAGLSAQAEFDVIFCNSAFQWFRNERQALESCYRALRTGGRMAIQAPGSAEYCPNFLAALEQVDGDSETSAWFAHFHSPWLFLDSAEEYKALFESVGFQVPFSRIDVTHTRNTPTEVMSVFDSGAAAGYLDPANYDVELPSDYPDAFRRVLSSAFGSQAGRNGYVDLFFNRIYLVAEKIRESSF